MQSFDGTMVSEVTTVRGVRSRSTGPGRHYPSHAGDQRAEAESSTGRRGLFPGDSRRLHPENPASRRALTHPTGPRACSTDRTKLPPTGRTVELFPVFEVPGVGRGIQVCITGLPAKSCPHSHSAARKMAISSIICFSCCTVYEHHSATA